MQVTRDDTAPPPKRTNNYSPSCFQLKQAQFVWKVCFGVVKEKIRSVGATQMNDTSSRSHSVFQIIFTQTRLNKDMLKATDKLVRWPILIHIDL